MLNPTWLEIGILLAFLIASALLFYRAIQPVASAILSSPPDPGFRLRPLRKRILDFIWEVALQGKVIRERPLPGLAHALVFWGFCAFALVTVDHFAAGFGLGFLHDGGWTRAYHAFAATFAVAVMASMLGLAIRRFWVRPRWLGEVSRESAIITALILTLMGTYLLSFSLPHGSSSAKANWWVHAAAILIFLPLIAKTKHLHLLLSPVTIFLSRGSFSRIPPLNGDDDFGIVTGKDLTRIVALQAFSCVECGRCTEHCPANNTGKVLDPKKIALGVRQYLRDHGANGTEPLVGKYIDEEALFQCTSCGACEYQCPVGIEHLPIIVGLRRGRVNTGEWDNSYGNKLFLSLERNGNALGMAASERDKFITKNELPIFDGSQEYCLWLGCMGSYDPRGREIVTALVSILRHLGATFGVLKKEKCTGDPIRRLGNDYLFTQLAEANLEQLKATRAIKLLSICPHCVRTIAEDWREAGATVSIEHHSEFLARHAAQLPAKEGPLGKAVFHDPCYLGRYRDIYNEPRVAVGSYMELVEPERTQERSFCCGAGGGLAFLGEEKGKRVSHERVEQLTRTGARTIAAACPFCNTMFRDALAQLPAQPQLLDIAQIAAASLPKV